MLYFFNKVENQLNPYTILALSVQNDFVFILEIKLMRISIFFLSVTAAAWWPKQFTCSSVYSVVVVVVFGRLLGTVSSAIDFVAMTQIQHTHTPQPHVPHTRHTDAHTRGYLPPQLHLACIIHARLKLCFNQD